MNDLKSHPKLKIFMNFLWFLVATHILKVNCTETATHRPIHPAIWNFHFSALNVDFSSPSPDSLSLRRPAHEGVKEGYPLKVVILLLLVRVVWQVIWAKLMRRATTLPVPIRKFSWLFLSILTQFPLEIYIAATNCKKQYNPYFKSSRSFKVIDVHTNKKLVTIACYDKQHVSAYLQSFSFYTSQ